jgi:polyhydroxyalkanoate synthesis regulator phasin
MAVTRDAAAQIHRKSVKMKPFDDAAYTMAAVSAVVALYRTLVKNGALTRDEAVRALLDEAVSRAIQAEAQQQGEATAAHDLNRQCAEILKFIAEKL